MNNNLSKLSVPMSLVTRKSGEKASTLYRDDFVHDRDRIMYSKAFRRLAGKTQVYRTGIDDHSRTRLTHTIEVTQIARTISNALCLNSDLAEAIALGHDVGHAPFGHAGERILHSLVTPNLEISTETKKHAFEKFTEVEIQQYKDQYGYKHNHQSVRICSDYGTHDGNNGLDLTNYTLWGIQNHSKLTYSSKSIKNFDMLGFYDRYLTEMSIDGDTKKQAWSYEAFVVRISDEIAQMHHDLEDALRCRAFQNKDALRIVNRYLFEYMDGKDVERFHKLEKELNNEVFIDQLSKVVVNTLISEVIKNSKYNLECVKKSIDDKGGNFEDFFTNSNVLDNNVNNIINYVHFDDPKSKSKIPDFKDDTSRKILNTSDVHRSDSKGMYIIRKLFDAYYSNPQQLPDHIIENFMVTSKIYKSKDSLEYGKARNGIAVIRSTFMKQYNKPVDENDKTYCLILMRLICDHISSMTDNYAIQEYQELYS